MLDREVSAVGRAFFQSAVSLPGSPSYLWNMRVERVARFSNPHSAGVET